MDTDKLLQDLKTQLLLVLGEQYKDLKPELEQDINAFLEESRGKLERWALLLTTSSITEEEFEWLLKSQQDLMELQTLQAAGISKIKLNNIKNSILKTVIQVVIQAIILV